ncbi:quinone oxidoreductase family protein [Actinacidiphila glaucinigra]|uniref:quinone oxidoreductase family protein n=1 Tax=Actinacidiphila glaucinigra TaxID=235986 RepID=UPI0029A63DAC|nr:quinone oxidoreductase [Streptomyces sp. PA03-3a]
MRAITITELGGPEVLRLIDAPAPHAGPGHLVVDVRAAGVNFMDTGARQNGPAGLTVPFVPGVEAAGVVREVGPEVAGFAPGDRVAWVYSYGTYAERVAVPAAVAVPVPDDVDDETAAALMMQGITAHHFTTEAYPVAHGDVALVHAAAGGLGRLITQLVKLRGGTAIGVVSRPEKAAVAHEAGADHVVVSTGGDFVDPVRALTGDEGVHVVFDGNGETTFRASMQALRRHGTLLYYGAFIGQVPTISMRELPNSIKVSYPVFRDHIPDREALLHHAGELFDFVRDGRLKVAIGGRYPLAEAEQAHRDIESRSTTGKLLLIVGE